MGHMNHLPSRGHSADKRGFTYAEAINYLGIGRRTFDTGWKFWLPSFRQGTAVIYDRADLDALFEQRKAEAAAAAHPNAPDSEQNRRRNERPIIKGAKPWANNNAASAAKATSGPSTRNTGGTDFASALQAVRKQRAGSSKE
jgi:hypothetical protein